MARDLVGETRVDFLHARDGGFNVRITFRAALFQIANGFNPVAHAVGGRPVHPMARRETQPLNGNRLLYARRVHTGVVQHDGAPQGMPDEPDREIVDDIEQRG